MKISLRQIEIFLHVVETGYLTQVAKDLNLSQSAVSMSIKELENIIGRKLFDRISKKLILNEIGRSFYDTVKPIYRKLEDIENEFKNVEDKGQIRVGASTTIVDYLIPLVVCDYMKTYPNVKINLKEGNTQHIVDLVKSGAVDIGFIEGNIEDGEIIKEIVGQDELVIVTANDAIDKDKVYDLKDIQDYKWVLREKGSGTRENFLSCIKNSDAKLNVFLELGHTESIKSLLVSKKPISCVSRLAVHSEIENGTLFEVKVKNFKCRRNFFAIYHRDKFRSELFNKLYDFSKAKISEAMRSRGCLSEFNKSCEA